MARICSRTTSSRTPSSTGLYVKGVCVVLLFNALEFVLYRAENGQPKAMRKGQWTTPGAAQAIQTFFAAARGDPPLLSLLHSVVDITACRLSTTGSLASGRSCFLGAGASGHADSMTSSDSAVRGSLTPALALKLVLHPSESRHMEVRAEFERQLRAAAEGAPVVAPVADSAPRRPRLQLLAERCWHSR